MKLVWDKVVSDTRSWVVFVVWTIFTTWTLNTGEPNSPLLYVLCFVLLPVSLFALHFRGGRHEKD